MWLSSCAVWVAGGVAIEHDDLHARAQAILSRLHERQPAALGSQHGVGVAHPPAAARHPGFGGRSGKSLLDSDPVAPGQWKPTFSVGVGLGSSYNTGSSGLRAHGLLRLDS